MNYAEEIGPVIELPNERDLGSEIQASSISRSITLKTSLCRSLMKIKVSTYIGFDVFQ